MATLEEAREWREQKRFFLECTMSGATVLAAIFAFWVAYRTADLANDSAINLEAGTRAYIAVTGARFDGIPEAGKNQRIKILFKNVGKEPASDASHIWGWSGGSFKFKLDDKDMPFIDLSTTKWPRIDRCDTNPVQILNRRPIYAEANNEAIIHIFNTGPEFLPQRVIDGTASFYVFGCFVYRSFGKTRTSPYCLYYQPVRGKPIKDGTFEWCPIGSGNAT